LAYKPLSIFIIANPSIYCHDQAVIHAQNRPILLK